MLPKIINETEVKVKKVTKPNILDLSFFFILFIPLSNKYGSNLTEFQNKNPNVRREASVKAIYKFVTLNEGKVK